MSWSDEHRRSWILDFGRWVEARLQFCSPPARIGLHGISRSETVPQLQIVVVARVRRRAGELIMALVLSAAASEPLDTVCLDLRN
jgi:hypothetical protein